MRLEREVAGFQQPDVGARDVTLKGLGSSGQEERVVPAPDGQQRWLARPEVLLERGVQLDVAGVVEEEIQLNLVRARTGEVVVVEGVTVRRNQRRVGDSVSILPHGRLGLNQAADRVTVSLRGFLPVRTDGVPAVTEPFRVRIAV